MKGRTCQGEGVKDSLLLDLLVFCVQGVVVSPPPTYKHSNVHFLPMQSGITVLENLVMVLCCHWEYCSPWLCVEIRGRYGSPQLL